MIIAIGASLLPVAPMCIMIDLARILSDVGVLPEIKSYLEECYETEYHKNGIANARRNDFCKPTADACIE